MTISTNPLIGASFRETIENSAEALSAAIVLMADKHSDLCRLLNPVLRAMEHAANEAKKNDENYRGFSREQAKTSRLKYGSSIDKKTLTHRGSVHQ